MRTIYGLLAHPNLFDNNPCILCIIRIPFISFVLYIIYFKQCIICVRSIDKKVKYNFNKSSNKKNIKHEK